MLNIEDIKLFNQKYLEPKEITECRQRIIAHANELTFNEAEHKYFLPNGNELPSVSSMIDTFIPEVDWDKKAENSAKKKGLSKEEVRRQWSENALRSTNNGTSTHLFGEAYMHFLQGDVEWIKANPIISAQYEKGYLIPYSPKQEAVELFYNAVYTNAMKSNVVMYPIIAEAKLHTDKYAGTADALFGYFDNEGLALMIYDWKTNASLVNNYNRQRGVYMKYPFNEYPYVDENLTHYTIQQSMYQVALENLSYRVASRSLIWLKDDSTFARVDVENVTEKIRGYFGV